MDQSGRIQKQVWDHGIKPLSLKNDYLDLINTCPLGLMVLSEERYDEVGEGLSVCRQRHYDIREDI